MRFYFKRLSNLFFNFSLIFILLLVINCMLINNVKYIFFFKKIYSYKHLKSINKLIFGALLIIYVFCFILFIKYVNTSDFYIICSLLYNL